MHFEEKYLNGKLYYRFTRNGPWSEYNKDRLVEMYMDLKKKMDQPIILSDLPDHHKIDTVAHEEAVSRTWDNRRFLEIYQDGFVEGALWMEDEIKKKYKI